MRKVPTLTDPTSVISASYRLREGVWLALQEGQRRSRQQRRRPDVVVRQARQDGKRVPSLRPALAHPTAVAQTAVEQLEHLDVVARRRHVGVRADDQGRHLETADHLAVVEVL